MPACKTNTNYGINCKRNCNRRHCASQSASCDERTGDCGSDGCGPGWEGIDCRQGDWMYRTVQTFFYSLI